MLLLHEGTKGQRRETTCLRLHTPELAQEPVLLSLCLRVRHSHGGVHSVTREGACLQWGGTGIQLQMIALQKFMPLLTWNFTGNLLNLKNEQLIKNKIPKQVKQNKPVEWIWPVNYESVIWLLRVHFPGVQGYLSPVTSTDHLLNVIQNCIDGESWEARWLLAEGFCEWTPVTPHHWLSIS